MKTTTPLALSWASRIRIDENVLDIDSNSGDDISGGGINGGGISGGSISGGGIW